jgi:hypothetical protein
MEIKNNLFKTNKPRTKGNEKGKVILGSAFLGAGVGAIGGLIYGYNQAQNEIKNAPVESVTLTYKLPTYETKEIGKIPQDQYLKSELGERDSGWWYGKVDLTSTKPVYEKVPVKDDTGKVVYREVTETFSGRGKPIINYNTYEVKEPVLKGYTQRIIKDEYYHYDKERGGFFYGNWIKFYPRVDYNVIDTYQVPQVSFEHGVDVLGKTMKGLALGAVVGAIIGGWCSWILSG